MFTLTQSNIRYLKTLAQIPKIALAAFGVTLLAKILAVVFEKIHGHETAFNQAVTLLLHYIDSISAIFAFFVVNLCLLCLTLLWEGADLSVSLRTWFVLPSFHILEHMISLTIGAYWALAIIESCTTGVPYGSVLKTLAAVIYVSIVLFVLAAICAFIVEFIKHDYSAFLRELGRLKFPVIFCIGGALLLFLYTEYVWHFVATVTHAQ